MKRGQGNVRGRCGTGSAARAGHAPPLRNRATFFTNLKPCGQLPRPLGRAGIKSEKAGFRLKNRLIVIFEVKSGFFPPLWGSRGTGPLGRGPRLAGSRLPSGLRRTALAVAGGACIWRSPFSLTLKCGPTRQTPHHLVQRDFSRFLFWSQKRNNSAAGCLFRSAPTRQTPHHLEPAGLFWYSFGHKRGTTPRQAAVPGSAPRASPPATCRSPTAANQSINGSAYRRRRCRGRRRWHSRRRGCRRQRSCPR